MIPIPSRDDFSPATGAYLVAVVVLLGLAGPTIAAHLHSRWTALRRSPMLVWHAGIAALVVLAGMVLTGREVWWPTGQAPAAKQVLIGLPAGLVIAAIVVRVDRAVTVWWGRVVGPGGRAAGDTETRFGPARPAGVASKSVAAGLRRTGLVRARNAFAPTPADLRVSWPLLMLVAIVEELTCRGVLLALALRAGSIALVAVAVIGVQLVFALTHVFFGWGQVLAKLPLAGFATVAVLLSGSVLPAVVAHALFNTWVWRYHRATPRFVPGGGTARGVPDGR